VPVLAVMGVNVLSSEGIGGATVLIVQALVFMCVTVVLYLLLGWLYAKLKKQ